MSVGWSMALTARQLLWLWYAVIASGLLLLLPLVAGWAPGPATRALGTFHSAASLLLVVGSLGHGIARILLATPTRRGVATGILSSTLVGVGALTGAALVEPASWADRFGTSPETVEHAAAILHYGYSGVLVGATAVWHARAMARDRWRPQRATLVVVLFTALVALLGSPPNRTVISTRLLYPAIGVLWAWTVLAPQLAWPWIRNARRGRNADKDTTMEQG